MKNYLKKAISAVIALALAASIVPASFAADVVLTDVPDTADYATAVKTLVALKVIDGYTDNTFLPENNITRAEASKVIVAALNETAAAEAMKGATKFSDIEAKHEWATGYINKGVSMGYINGMENNTFQPDGNVTYAQVIKMMLCAMGYEDYAVSLADQYNYTGANWYVPYTQLAADAGVTEGVYANPNDAVTRAQVAQLVYNAVKAPMVKNVGISYTDSGKIVPKIQIQDGSAENIKYRSILTEKFDAYYVEGYVTDTYKAQSGNALEAGEVKFAIAKSNKYDNDNVALETAVKDFTKVEIDGEVLPVVNVGKTAAADYINVYASAIVMVDDDDEWSFISFAPSGKNKTVELDAALMANDSDADSLFFWTDESEKKTNEYELADTAMVYVNGFKAGKITDTVGEDTVLEKYVLGQEHGTVTLVDIYRTTSGEYDMIYVDAYAREKVRAVSDDEIALKTVTLDLDKEANEDLEYHIYYNGEEITIAELKKDDILSIAYDINKTLETSNYYEIYVSRDTVTGIVRKWPDMVATIDGTDYDFVSSADYTNFKTFEKSGIKLGDQVTLKLDYFGDIYDWEVDASSINWGIAEKIAKYEADDEYKLTIFTADGATKSYYVDDDATLVIPGVEGTITETTVQAYINATGDFEENYNSTTKKNEIENRVVQYSVKSSTGKIDELKFVASVAENTGDDRNEYVEKRNNIGNIKLNAATKIIDACEIADKILAAAELEDLVDGVKYEAYAYGNAVNGAYPFVLITYGKPAYSKDTRFAVVTEEATPAMVDEADGFYEFKALYGEKDEVILVATDDDKADIEKLKVGDVIFFTTNTAGQIKSVDVIFSLKAGIENTSYANLATMSLKNGNADNKTDKIMDGETVANEIKIVTTGEGFGTPSSFTQTWNEKDTDYAKLVYGPIAEVEETFISFAKVADGKTTLSNDGVQEYFIDSSINVYKYDFGSKASNKFSATVDTTGAAIKAPNYITETVGANEVITWSKDGNNTKANFALALVVDNAVVEIFEFIAE